MSQLYVSLFCTLVVAAMIVVEAVRQPLDRLVAVPRVLLAIVALDRASRARK